MKQLQLFHHCSRIFLSYSNEEPRKALKLGEVCFMSSLALKGGIRLFLTQLVVQISMNDGMDSLCTFHTFLCLCSLM